MNDTSRENFKKFLASDEGVVKFGMALSDDYIGFALEGWDACESLQAEQAKLIAELAEALDDTRDDVAAGMDDACYETHRYEIYQYRLDRLEKIDALLAKAKGIK